MPRQNRATPFSELISSKARGTLMGNRGCLHNNNGRVRRHFQGKRWIICLLKFKGRHRQVMSPGRYTELFFLDEATALAAGHRPCAECQRGRFNLFRDHWRQANPDLHTGQHLSAPQLDAYLHQERLHSPADLLIQADSVAGLPDGAFVANEMHEAFLVQNGKYHCWYPDGYQPSSSSVHGPLRILTPPSTLQALVNGYPVAIHHSPTEIPANKTSN